MDTLQSMDDQFLTKINQLIDENLSNEHFSVEDLAQRVGLSRSMLHRKLIKLTGKSASDLITEKRLLKAKEMLENKVATASEIAYRVGFNSPSYFTKVFKNYYHVLPGDVRKGTTNTKQQKRHILTTENLKRPGLLLLLIVVLLIAGGTGMYYIIREKEPVEKSIAILPFDNLSSDAQNQYFADGIVEDLLNRLSSISNLKVISRTSSEMFRDKGKKSVREIAKSLDVNYILEGSVQRQASKVRIHVQLIDGLQDNHIFSKQYDRDLNEVFTIQSELAEEITSELSLILTDEQKRRIIKSYTNNLNAFDNVQLGRYFLNKRSREDNHRSITYFRQAIAEDPRYALAYAEMADAYFLSSWYGYIDRQTGRDSAEYLALKALEIDKNIGFAHTVLGAIYNEYDWNYRESEKEFRQAIQINPNHATSYHYYAEFLYTAGRLTEAREMMNKAIELDPYSWMIRLVSSGLYFQEVEYQKAIKEVKISQELSGNVPGTVSKELSMHIKLRNSDATLETYKKLGKITGEWSNDFADSLYNIDKINGLLRWRIQLGNWSYFIEEAHYYALVGDTNRAVDFLERKLKEGNLFPVNTADFELENLHSNPRFKIIREKMGLPPL